MAARDGTMLPVVARATNISHAYKKVRALEDVSLEIPAGKMIGLIGPDGVGKSTLLGLLSGARKLQQGQLDVLGGSMADAWHRNVVGPRIAYMPQGPGRNLYQELSIQENLDFFGKLFGQSRAERWQRIERLTTATGLRPFLQRPAGKLSGGMKQKTSLCCSLIHDPDLLILDEPTTGVDPLSRRQFWELIAATKAASPDMSVLVSTAYMDEAEAFDWLIAMDAGRILATGTAEDLKQRTGADTLEAAFVKLLPADKQHGSAELVIPPLETSLLSIMSVLKSRRARFSAFWAPTGAARQRP
jgi:ribosome-dependent ATPase